MKRKFLLLFLTIISAVCICAGLSACDLLSDLSSSIQDAVQGSSVDDGAEQESTDDEDSEQDSSGGENSDSEEESGGSEQSPSDGDAEQDSDGDSQTETDGSGDADSEEDDAKQDSDDDDQTKTDGDDGSEQSPSDDDTEQDPDDDQTESDEKGDTDTEKEDGGEVTADFTARAGNGTYGYCQLANETNGAEMQSLYYQMYTACETFVADTDDVAVKSGYYIISEISYGATLTTDEAVSVWEVFYLENPMYYWLSASCVYSESAGTIYLCVDEAYASYADRAVYDAAISAMVAEASALTSQQSSELEKAMAIHDYIIGKIDYAYQSGTTTPETAIWAHNITGVSSKGAGVCEAYAKTYLALCLISGLNCVIVTGYAGESGEAHAWNLVKIDGAWYGVDCTWDDTGDDDDLSYACFGMNASTLDSARVAGTPTYGVNYLYNLPEVTTCGIQPVTLFKGGTELGMCANIDAAFAAMTDSSADYTIEFYFYNYAGKKVETSPSATVYIYSACTPAVNSVTINGIYTDLGSGYFYASYLNIESKFTLKCDLIIGDIILTAAELDLGEYTLTTSGNYCRLSGSIYDSKTTETVSIKSAAASQTDIYAALNISYYYGGASISGTAVIGTYYGSDRLVVYGTATIDKYISANETNYYNIYLQDGAALTVNNLVYDSGSTKIINVLIQFTEADKYPSLYLGDVDAKTYLFISGYISVSEAAEPANLSCAIATLGSSSGFENIGIYFGSENKTSLYTVNADNEIIYN